MANRLGFRAQLDALASWNADAGGSAVTRATLRLSERYVRRVLHLPKKQELVYRGIVIDLQRNSVQAYKQEEVKTY